MANVLDPVTNFAIATIAGFAIGDTSASVGSGEGAKFPAPATAGAFNIIVWNSTDYRNPSDDPDKEILRVTARSTDALTFTRAQEGTSAAAHNTGGKVYKVILAPTAKTRDDIDVGLLKLAGVEAAADVTDAGNVGSSIHGATAKTTMADTDKVAIIDTEASNVLKTLTWAYVKSILKTYFDTLYIKVGTVVDFAGSTAPTGWLICDGATVSQTTYAALYAITGHAYGADPGGGNFILPNCKGKATVGYLSGDANFGALGNVAAGEKTHQLTTAELAAHAHVSYQYIISLYGGTGWTNLPAGTGSTNVNLNTSTPHSTDNAGSGTAHNNIQPSIVFNKIIKY